VVQNKRGGLQPPELVPGRGHQRAVDVQRGKYEHGSIDIVKMKSLRGGLSSFDRVDVECTISQQGQTLWLHSAPASEA
jgi:hypothetical protein